MASGGGGTKLRWESEYSKATAYRLMLSHWATALKATPPGHANPPSTSQWDLNSQVHPIHAKSALMTERGHLEVLGLFFFFLCLQAVGPRKVVC